VIDSEKSGSLFFRMDQQHRCIAARERDLAATVADPQARARHLTAALRHAVLAETQRNERLLIRR
jgi:hypothetical protein